VELDTLAIGPAATPVPGEGLSGPLGGWVRGFDTFTYEPVQPCAAGTTGATCQNSFEPLHTDGLLDRSGWRLLDDSQSALWTPQGWIQPRQRGGDLEDGYLFVYGHDYSGALHTFAHLTGSAPLLPRTIFGVWYSDYTPYSSATIERSLYPAFRTNRVPINTLSLDTDWKAPNNWDGWEWNAELFPDPGSFLRWAHGQGIAVTLNVHSSIAIDDPKLSSAERVAGTTLPKTSCQAGICKVWNWSSVPQAESNFALQQSFQKQGVAFWWLDWCCDASTVSMRGVTPDAWIGHLYAQEMVNRGQRGFVLGRIGSSNGNPQRVYPAGPWSDHTSAIAFTGDAWGTWNTLAQEAALTPDEATIGEPYVSDDIGSFLGAPPGTILDAADLYDRWVQLGTFQPILRLHSNNDDRLPWQYPEPVRSITEAFLRLREALVPYSYTLAAQAHADGTPMAQPLYLDYPGQADAYSHPEEYLYGADMLVAPVTSPGEIARTSVWIPPGRWVDYFTGATFTGPTTIAMSVPLDRMPVFVRAGGIIPQQPVSGTSTTAIPKRMILDVFPGSSRTFSLYSDTGSGLGYTKGQESKTPVTDTLTPGGATGPAVGVTIGSTEGHFPGQPRALAYRLDIVDVAPPSQVTLNGRRLAPKTSASSAPGWYYVPATTTVVVDTPSMPIDREATVVASGSGIVNRPEPPPASS
jgi:alpha-glucosidase (family GH31 glycosyl hydrolase)